MKCKRLLLFWANLILWNTVFSQSIIGVHAYNKVNPYKYNINKNQKVLNGGVVSAHPLASNVGVAILKMGGNAFDAAIATQLVLAVVYPGAGNLGGGGFLVARKNNGKSFTLDYREKAPAAASRDMYLDANGNANTLLSQNGALAAGVPGTVAGLDATYKHAKLPWKVLVQPAIDLAENGFCITAAEAAGLNAHQEEFKQYSTMPAAFIKDISWKAGDTLVQKDLAATLKRIQEKGKSGFYEGETATLLVEEMQRAHGIIRAEDLLNYQVVERTAISVHFQKKYTIITMPPPSSGGVLLTMMLHMLENRKLHQMKFQSPAYIQLLTEVERRAYADRAEHIGDADFYPVPLKTLLSKTYAKQRMEDYKPGIAQKSAMVKAGVIPKESEETTHLSIFDKEGNMVAVTTTLNGSYGSKTIVGSAGFLLNNEMDDFSVKPGVPNMYGAIGGEANAIVPGKRMLSSMTPTLVLKNNRPYIVCGTPGGTTIITSVLQTILNILVFDMSAELAVNRPKFHHQWLPDAIFVEKNIEAKTISALEKMGYSIEKRTAIGRTEVIKINAKKNIELAADTRGDDAAAGYAP